VQVVIGNAFFMCAVISLPLNLGRLCLALLRHALGLLSADQLLGFHRLAAAHAPLVAGGVRALVGAALPRAHEAAATTAAAAGPALAAAVNATANASAGAGAAAAATAAAVAGGPAAAPAPTAAAAAAAAVAAAGLLGGGAAGPTEVVLLATAWGDPLPVAWAAGWERLARELGSHVSFRMLPLGAPPPSRASARLHRLPAVASLRQC
jgi:hypothetical protein